MLTDNTVASWKCLLCKREQIAMINDLLSVLLPVSREKVGEGEGAAGEAGGVV